VSPRFLLIRNPGGKQKMTYEDPSSGRERNLGQDDANGSSFGTWAVGFIIAAAAIIAAWSYFGSGPRTADVGQPNRTAAENSTILPAPQQSSGPAMKGAEGGKNGPAANSNENPSSTGASSGTSGSGGDSNSATQPSQDSTGVKGDTGGKNGPAQSPPTTP
jgi:hypothetical protein